MVLCDIIFNCKNNVKILPCIYLNLDANFSPKGGKGFYEKI